MASSNQVRQQLLADYGECVCSPDMCFDDPNGDGYCRPCARMDPYWSCFAEVDDEDESVGVSAEAHAEIAEAPRSLRDVFTDSRGAPCFTSLDRRWLWRIDDHLAVNATTEFQRDLRRDLSQYLHETCEHHMLDYLTCCDPPNETCTPPHRQCTWCNHVEWVEAGT